CIPKVFASFGEEATISISGWLRSTSKINIFIANPFCDKYSISLATTPSVTVYNVSGQKDPFLQPIFYRFRFLVLPYTRNGTLSYHNHIGRRQTTALSSSSIYFSSYSSAYILFDF